MKIRNTEFDFENKAYIMGILNVTPDSFSDGGRFTSVENAVAHVKKMIEEGVDIIDIGGESTRPGHTPVSSEEEIERIIPVIKAIREFSDVPISIDTFKAETLEAAVQAGADVANDIWGFMADEKMADVCGKYNLPVILMHNRRNNEYEDFIPDFKEDLKKSIELAISKGVAKDRIIIDPGVGFALDYEKDLTIINRLDELKSFGYPILLATSRKRFIGKATGVEKADERVIGTAITTAIGYERGARMFRVHDVKANKEALKMVEALLREGR